MNDRPYDKSTVEAIPLGQVAFSISGPREWATGDRVQRWLQTARDILNEISEQIPACQVVRLIAAAGDVGSEVIRWQRELGRPEIITNEAAAVTAAKTLVWGAGEPETTYAVVIIAESLAAEVAANAESSSLAKTVFIHELAHVHDDFVRLRRFGPQSLPMSNDWPGIRHWIALSAWGEFFAESIAASYSPDDALERALRLGKDILESALTCISSAKAQYSIDGNIVPVWCAAQDGLSKIFDQIGRMLGTGAVWKEDMTENDLMDAQINPQEWRAIILTLNERLRAIGTLDNLNNEILNIEALVEKGFNLAGLYPHPRPEGLQLSIV